MRDPQNTIASIRDEVLEFQQKLEQKVTDLSKEGILTSTDKRKIDGNMRETLNALSNALNGKIEQEKIREGWVLGVVKIYEDEIVKIIREVENRRYTDKQLSIRINSIKQQVLAQRPLSSHERKGRIETEAAKLEKQLWEDIHGISQKHSRRPQLMETWLQEFESNLQSLLIPRINVRSQGDEHVF